MSKVAKVIKSIKEGTFFYKLHIFLTSNGLFSLIGLIFGMKKVVPKRVVFCNFNGRGFADNPKYIAMKLHELAPDFEIYWLTNRNLCNSADFPKFIKTVDINSMKTLEILATSKFWVDNTRKTITVAKKRSQFYIQTWHGGLGIKKIELDAVDSLSKKYIRYAKKDSRITDLCISGTKKLSKIFKNSFWYSGDVLECGSPRNDILVNGESGDAVRQNLGLVEYKLCLYAPTFRKDYGIDCYKMDFHGLCSVLHEKFGGKWKVLIRLHPNMADKALPFLTEDVINVTSYPDCQELLLIADCVVSDFSSVAFEFMLTDRPVFFYASDFDNYITSDRGVYFPIENYFEIARDEKQLSDSVRHFDSEKYTSQVNDFFALYGIAESGKASETVAKVIIEKSQE